MNKKILYILVFIGSVILQSDIWASCAASEVPAQNRFNMSTHISFGEALGSSIFDDGPVAEAYEELGEELDDLMQDMGRSRFESGTFYIYWTYTVISGGNTISLCIEKDSNESFETALEDFYEENSSNGIPVVGSSSTTTAVGVSPHHNNQSGTLTLVFLDTWYPNTATLTTRLISWSWTSFGGGNNPTPCSMACQSLQ